MKLYAVVVCVFAMLILSTVPMSTKAQSSPSSTWRVEKIDNGAVNVISSIAVDSKGDPHIAYENMYASWNGTTWIYETMTGCPGSVTSLTLDKNDVPHLALTGIAVNSSYLSWYGNKTGGTWNYKLVDIDSYGGDIAIDNNGVVHIAYNAIGVKYAKLVNGTFKPSTVDGDQYSEIDTDRAIAVDSKDIPHIGYRNPRAGPPAKINYTNYLNGSWNLSTINTHGQGAVAIIIVNDTPYLSFRNASGLCCSHWDGTKWDTELVDGSSGGVTGDFTSIATNNIGKICISYVDDSDPNHLKVKQATQNGTNWDIELVDTAKNTTEQMDHTSLAMDNLGYSYITYRKGASGIFFATNKPSGVFEFTTIIIPSIVIIALFVVVLKRKNKNSN